MGAGHGGGFQEGWGRPTDMSKICFFINSNDTGIFKTLVEDSII